MQHPIALLPTPGGLVILIISDLPVNFKEENIEMTREEASAYIARLNRDEKLRLLNMLIAISKISPQERQETMNMVDNPHGNGGTAEVSV